MALASVLSQAAQLALHNAGVDITGLQGNDVGTVQTLVSRAIDQEWKPETLAGRLNPVIGLGPRYAAAVENLRAGLQAQKKLSPAQITQRVDAYTKRLKRSRARTVANFESRKQKLDAQRLQWQQDQGNGILPVDAVKRFHYDWHERGCALCYSQDGGIRSLSDPFGPPLHPNCGCWETVHVHDTARGKVPLIKLEAAPLIKDVVHWVEAQHPRYPKGTPGHKGGEFAPKGAGGALDELGKALRQANSDQNSGEEYKIKINRLYMKILADDPKTWDAVQKAVVPVIGDNPNEHDLGNSWARSVGFDEQKTQAAITKHNTQALTKLRENLQKMDPAYIQKFTEDNYYGSHLDKLLKEGPKSFTGKANRYELADLMDAVRRLQGQVNNDGNTGKISSMDHFVWSNGLNTDDVVTDDYGANRLGLQKYREALPDLNTEEGRAKVRAAAFVRNVVDEWASNSDSSQSQAMQMAVAEFSQSIGMKADDFSGLQKYSDYNYKEALDLYKTQRPALLDLARAMYEETQKDLAARGITSVWASRGMAVDEQAAWMKENTAGSGFGELSLQFQQNPLTSWSTDLQTSAGFGDARYKFVAYQEIPAREIFCTAMTGLGCLHEYEMVVLGTKQVGVIRWVDTNDTENGQDWLEGGKEPSSYQGYYGGGGYSPHPGIKKAAPAKKAAAKKIVVPKVTAGTKLYVPKMGPIRFYKQTASGQWYVQSAYSGWYKLPKGWKGHSLKLYKPVQEAALKGVAKKIKAGKVPAKKGGAWANIPAAKKAVPKKKVG